MQRVMKTVAAVLMIVGPGAQAQNWTTLKLNTLAVTNASGAIVVLGTEGSYTGGASTMKEAVFDGNTSTFFDPASNVVGTTACWAGFQLQTPKMVTRVRYWGRAAYPNRMKGVLFQGSNTSNFTDAVTLHTANPPSGWLGTNVVDVTLTTTNTFQTFSYLRIIGPNALGASANEEGTCCGNAAEVEFYGADLATNAPAVPSVDFADALNGFVNLRWTVVSNAMIYEVQRVLTNEAAYSTVANLGFQPAGVNLWRDSQFLYGNAHYRVRARNNLGDSDWSDFGLSAHNVATGVWFGVTGSYGGGGSTGDKMYDGRIDTYFDGPEASGGSNLWSALDLGAVRTITGIRYLPRSIWASRMPGGLFQAAGTTNFSDAVTLYTVSAAPSYTAVSSVTLDTPVSCRYVRYVSPVGGWGNVAEVEFDLAASAPASPTGLAITHSDVTNDYPILTWSYGTSGLLSSGMVYRATAPGGPYTAVSAGGVTGASWTDTNLLAGVLYYYRVCAQYTDGTALYESAPTPYQTYRRCLRIERSWDNLAALKSGMTAKYFFSNAIWYPAANLFDNSLATFGDAGPANCRVGVDFGEAYAVAWLRFSPRSNWIGRVNGSVIQGSNDVSQTPVTTLATLSNSVYGAFTALSTVDSNAYRYVFATRLDGNEFYGNLAELELYGWPAANATNVLTAPLSVGFTQQPSSLLIAWSAGNGAASYRVEREPADGSGAWTTVGTTASLSLTDAAPVYGATYLYRVVSLRTTGTGTEEAYSDSYPVIAYVPGSGTGLAARYTVNFTLSYRPDEAVASVQTNATIDFSWTNGAPLVAGVASSSNNVLVAWTGKLIVPYDGTYTFYVTSDDGAALRIDNAFVVNEWYIRSATSTGTVALTAGEHALRYDYFQNTGTGVARLEWSASGSRAVVPSSQLIPVASASDDIGAWHGRTFNAPKLGYHAYDATNKAITVASYGLDLSGGGEGDHFVWQPIGGPFLLEAKVTQNADPLATSAKALLMVRSAVATGNTFLAPARMATGQIGCKGRTAVGGNIADLLSPAWQGSPSNPCWMRIKRVGSLFTAQYKNSGGDWSTFYTFVDTNGVFGTTVYAGFAVAAPPVVTTTALQSAAFSEIRLTPLYGTILQMR